jgi:hypothetical protein
LEYVNERTHTVQLGISDALTGFATAGRTTRLNRAVVIVKSFMIAQVIRDKTQGYSPAAARE